MKLIPVKYHTKNYPPSVCPRLIEVAGNLDSGQLRVERPYSLHTEYAYGERRLDSGLLEGLDELKNAHRNKVPQLWASERWSREYAVFLRRLVGRSAPPEVIEIHPPFLDCCADFGSFWDRYLVFRDDVKAAFPHARILLENRCGTKMRSRFLLSTCADMLAFCEFLSDGRDGLGLIVDYPQLFSAEGIRGERMRLDRILWFNRELKRYAGVVGAIHLWGKRRAEGAACGPVRWQPHYGDLNTFFSGDQEKKAAFLASMKETFDDAAERYFVPEVNSTERDLHSIVNDLISAGMTFV